MTREKINDKYFDWMYGLVCDSQRLSYRKLLRFLHERTFTYTIPMDGNREADGIDLRYRFAYDFNYSRPMIATYLDDKPCSVLEMMVALVVRCEEHIMSDPDIGDRTGHWFFAMISNLGLESMDDSRFDARYVDEVIDNLLDRNYEPDGRGGLFTVENCAHDLRNVDIWYQMCWYLNTL